MKNVVITCVVASALASAQSTLKPPAVPPQLEVPQGNSLFMKGEAVGTQNYICKLSGSTYKWVLFGPQATLFVTYQWFGGDVRQQVTTHYLSANPDESDTARPTWQSSLDSSSVWGKAVANTSDPAYVAEGAIPWLLVQAAGSRPGPMGGTLLSQTTFIQRVKTAGGVEPATGCSEGTAGNTALVPYTTDYYFYRATQR